MLRIAFPTTSTYQLKAEDPPYAKNFTDKKNFKFDQNPYIFIYRFVLEIVEPNQRFIESLIFVIQRTYKIRWNRLRKTNNIYITQFIKIMPLCQ